MDKDTKENKVQEPVLGYGDSTGGVVTDFDVLDLSKLYTYANYLTWRFNERVELIKGKIFKMSPAPARRHQAIAVRIVSDFEHFLRRKMCKVYPAPFDVRLPSNANDKNPYTVVQPDICVICDSNKLDDKGCFGAPDLIVEILSPFTSAKDTSEKFELYQEHGVGEYWIVDPSNNVIDIFLLDNVGKYQLKGKYNVKHCICPQLFPELKINLTEVFED